MPNRAELVGAGLLLAVGLGVIAIPFLTSITPLVSVVGVLIVTFGQVGLETNLFTFGVKSISAGGAIAGIGYVTSASVAFVGVGVVFAVLGGILVKKSGRII